MRLLPRSLRGQFALSLGAMALLVVAGGALAVKTLLDSSDDARAIASEQLGHMQDAQALLDHTRQVQLYAANALAGTAVPDRELGYEAIAGRLDELDRLTARLATANDTTVLDLHHHSQLFRSSAQVVAQLRELSAGATPGDELQRNLQQAVAQMQEHARRLAWAAQERSAVFSSAYQASADRMAATSRRNAVWVAALLLGSLASALLIAHYFLGQHVVARLRRVSEALREPDGAEPMAARLPLQGEDEVAQMARAVEQSLRNRRQLAQARQRIDESGQRLAAVLENTADAIIVVQAGRLLQLNRAAQRLLGAPSAGLAGRPAADFIAPEVFDTAVAGLGATLDTSVRRVDGSELPVEVAVSQVASADGRLAILVARDATLRREAERHLREARDAAEAARAAQAAFLAAMSHELRTPLNAILGYAQLLKLDQALGEPQARQVDIIERSGQHLLALINDVLDLAKHEAGRMELALAPVPLAELVRTVGDIVRVQAEEAGLQFDVQLDPALPAQLLADERRLKQVLLNLLGNAVKFTERGQVRLVVRSAGGPGGVPLVHFEVSDTGVGLSAAQVASIFRPFEQVGDQRRRAAGTGLGLAISQQLVRLMGGEIGVASEPGRGSRFHFQIPVQGAGAAPAVAADIVGYDGPRRRVLVADDEPAGRQLLCDLLQPLGFDVVAAVDGRQALEQARRRRPDLVITDSALPQLSGLGLAAALQADSALRAVPVLMLSASIERGELVAAAGAAAPAFLAKPVDRAQLLAEVGRLAGLAWRRAGASDTGRASS